GVLTDQDVDVFELVVAGEAQLYRLQAVGDGLAELAVLEPNGAVRQSVRRERRLRLYGLALLPGRHLVSVRGRGEYALRALSQGPAPAEALAPAAGPGVVPADAPIAAVPATPEPADPDALEALPPPPPGVLELEPNDDASRANRLVHGRV